MRYIRQVHVDHPGTSNQHISAIRYSLTITGITVRQTREQAVADIDRRVDLYRSHNDATWAEAPVVTATSGAGTRYLRTVQNGTETDNLLQLPRF